MASLVLGVAGNAAFGPVGGFIGAAIGGVIDSYLFGPDDQTNVGPRLDSLKVTSSAYGRPIPIIYGRMRLGGNVAWSPGLVEHEVQATEGGKGTGPSVTTVTFVYTVSFRIVFGEGPADAILRVWFDNKLVRDRTGTGAVQNFFDTSAPGDQAVREYLGTETQKPDPAEQADVGLANSNAYRGLVSMVYVDLPVADYGNRIPQPTAEVAMDASESFPVTTITTVTPIILAEWQPGGATFIATGGSGEFGRFDAVNFRELATGSFGSDPDFPCVDSQGNFYRATDGWGTPDGGVVSKYDGVTFGLIQEGAPMVDPATGADILSSLNWSGGQVFGGIPLADGTLALELLFLGRDTLSSTSDVAIVDIAALGNAYGGAINFYTAPTALSSRTTVDGERYLWAFSGDESGDTILYRISPATGLIVETYTVSGDTTSLIAYEASTNSLILCNGASLIRWGLDSHAVDARLDNISPTILTPPSTRNESAFRNGPSGEGRMYLQTGAVLGQFAEFDVLNMVKVRSWDIDADWGLDGATDQWGLYDPIHHAVIKNGGGAHWLFLDRMSGNDVTVRSIIEDISSREGLVAGTDINATALTDTLPGYIIDRRMPGRRAAEPLAAAFFVRAVETDDKVVFMVRGGATVFAIPDGDLGARQRPEDDYVELEETRLQETELPLSVDVNYAAPDIDYQAMTQRAQRISEAVNTLKRMTFNFPGALNQGQAARIAERMLYLIWTNRVRHAFTTDWTYLRLDPGDIGTITVDGVTQRMEI